MMLKTSWRLTQISLKEIKITSQLVSREDMHIVVGLDEDLISELLRDDLYRGEFACGVRVNKLKCIIGHEFLIGTL